MRGAFPRCELTLRRPVFRTQPDVIRTKFDQVSAPGADGTVLTVENVGQGSVRALLTLLWTPATMC